jgi:cytochrome c oxidase subunit 3
VSSEPPAILNEPWTTTEREHVAMQFGVWSFLATEALFFGALFLFYAVSRCTEAAGFAIGAHEADFWFGTANTVVLMTSSLTMAMAERATKHGLVALARAMVIATLTLGAAFLVVKGFEYRSDVIHHLVPGPHFKFAVRGAAQFWSFYWTATVVHAIHLTIGLGIVSRLLFIPRGDLPQRWTTAVGTALYWHLVDIVWVILYPLIYLVGRP